MSCKNSVLESSGLDFGGPGTRFRRALGGIFRDFGLLGKETAGTHFELEAKAARFQLGARVAHSSYSHIVLQPRFPKRVGGGDPPQGVFNGIEANLVILAPKKYGRRLIKRP